MLALRRAIAEWRLGGRPVEDVPNAALDALADGLETPTLARLAAMEGASWSEIGPVVDRVAEEVGGPFTEHDAKVLVADEWLEDVAAGATGPAIHGGHQLREEILGDLGGAYEWFRRAIYDLDILDAMQDHEAHRAGVEKMRLRAAEVLERSVEQRLGAPEPDRDERPFLRPGG